MINRIAFTLLFVVSTSSFAQTELFWNNYANFNPAMSGFQYQYHASATVGDFSTWNRGLETAHANYGQRILGKHGVGLTYSSRNYFWNFNTIKLNYNYQFDLKRAGKIAPGIGIGFRQASPEYDMYIIPPTTILAPRTYGVLNLGVAYSWKKLLVGVSTTDFTDAWSYSTSGSPFSNMGTNMHASYDFQLGKNFQLTPRAFFEAQHGFRTVNTNLTATYKRKYSLGFSSQIHQSIGVNMGWDIKERFRVAYQYMIPTQALSHPQLIQNHRIHTFSVGFMIKDRKPKELPID